MATRWYCFLVFLVISSFHILSLLCFRCNLSSINCYMQSKIISDKMPARKRAGASTINSNNSDDNNSNDKDNEAYKLKRKRNNDAVKRTREKSKQTARERQENVEKLRIENKQLEAKIEEVKKTVDNLKDLLLRKVDPQLHDKVIEEILAESTDDETGECDS